MCSLDPSSHIWTVWIPAWASRDFNSVGQSRRKPVLSLTVVHKPETPGTDLVEFPRRTYRHPNGSDMTARVQRVHLNRYWCTGQVAEGLQETQKCEKVPFYTPSKWFIFLILRIFTEVENNKKRQLTRVTNLLNGSCRTEKVRKLPCEVLWRFCVTPQTLIFFDFLLQRK